MFVKGVLNLQDIISVIIPVYKVEKYLKRCVNSVINQTYKNLEIILVDDGSPDNCGKICDEYAKKDNRIKVIHKENGGAASSRNKGLDIATGRYICFVDSDDYVEKGFIERLHALVTDNDADIAQCGYCETFDGEAKFVYSDEEISIFCGEEMIEKLYSDGEQQIATVVLWTKIYKREIFNEYRLLEGIMYEDEALMPKLLYSAKKVVVSKDRLYAYFMSQNSVMRTPFSMKKLDYITALEHRIKFYKEKKMDKYIDEDMRCLMLKCLSYYWEADGKELKKELLCKSREYFKHVIKSNMSLKRKIKFILYRIHPVFVKLI